MKFRELKIDELDSIWKIDRSEYVDSIYKFKNGELVEKKIGKTFHGWSPDTKEAYPQILKDCFKRGGFFLAGFDNESIKAIGVLESKFIGQNKPTLQIKFLHIDRALRGKGYGRFVFSRLVEKAKEWNAKRLYISSCETKNTVNFYKKLGCRITKDLDNDLFNLEPFDIHMEYLINEI